MLASAATEATMPTMSLLMLFFTGMLRTGGHYTSGFAGAVHLAGRDSGTREPGPKSSRPKLKALCVRPFAARWKSSAFAKLLATHYTVAMTPARSHEIGSAERWKVSAPGERGEKSPLRHEATESGSVH